MPKQSTDPVPEADMPSPATINRDVDGEPLGASLFLGVEDLVTLGIDPDASHAVVYWAENKGLLRIVSRAEVEGDD